MNPADYSVISFPFLGLEVNPPRSFSIGSLDIHLYGLVIALGLLLWKRNLARVVIQGG